MQGGMQQPQQHAPFYPMGQVSDFNAIPQQQAQNVSPQGHLSYEVSNSLNNSN
jgi:hypothetical protein